MQATFGDAGGSELPYLDVVVDYSEAWLFNYITVTREGGLTQTSQDATSIARYGKRTLSITGLLVLDDFDAAFIAFDLKNKYKDPFTRVTEIAPNMLDANTALAVLQRELGDGIRILRTPPYIGGGETPPRIDQSPWIQKIEPSGEPGRIWRARLGVSPR